MSQLESLHERMRPVYLNGRFAGEITESEWRFIVAHVAGDRRLWEAQVKNVLRVIARAAGFGFISMPIGLFWTAAMLGWIGKPVTIGGIHAQVGGLLAYPQLVAAGVALAFGSMLAIGLKLGYVNFFAKARSALLKEHLGIDEPGHCTAL